MDNLDDFYLEIYAESEEALMFQLEDYSLDELRVLSRCASRHLNNKLNGSPLIGKHFDKKKAKAESVTIDDVVECKTNWSVEQTITVDEYTDPVDGSISVEDFMKAKSLLDCCANTTAKAAAPVTVYQWNIPLTGCVKPNSMETDMSFNTPTTSPDFGFAETRKYLLNRLNTLESEKYVAAEEKFLPVTEMPKTGKELKDAIANGWLVTNAKDDTKFNWDSPLHYLEFVDPAKPRDRDGYEKAVALVAKAKTEAKDTIMVLPHADGLAALKAFEGTTYH